VTHIEEQIVEEVLADYNVHHMKPAHTKSTKYATTQL